MANSVYATVDEFKASMARGVTVSEANIPTLQRALTAASRQIDRYTGWLQHGFWIDDAVTTRTFDAEDAYWLCVPQGIATTTGLIVKVDYDANGTFETTLTLGTDYQLLPFDADDDSWPWTEVGGISSGSNYFPPSTYGRAGVQITAKFGWPAVPAEVKEATVIQAGMIWKAPEAPFGAAGLGDTGIAMRIGRGLHPTAAGLLSAFTKPAVG